MEPPIPPSQSPNSGVARFQPDMESPGVVPLVPSRTQAHPKRWWGPIGVIGLLIAKLGSKLAFLIPLLKLFGPFAKTGLSMVFSIWVYSQFFGWTFGLGFVVLIFVHELGHVLAAYLEGIRITAPLFIPFMGAQITLRQNLPDAWVEAKLGIGGPLAGTAAAGFCHLIYGMTDRSLFAALAYVGYWINFFNLIPIVPLDGGRVMAAISPWAWLVGFVVMAGWLALELYGAATGVSSLGPGTFILVLVLLTSLPRVLRLFRNSSPELQRYYSVSTFRRWLMGGIYFGLVAVLLWGMHVAHFDANGEDTARSAVPTPGVGPFPV